MNTEKQKKVIKSFSIDEEIYNRVQSSLKEHSNVISMSSFIEDNLKELLFLLWRKNKKEKQYFELFLVSSISIWKNEFSNNLTKKMWKVFEQTPLSDIGFQLVNLDNTTWMCIYKFIWNFYNEETFFSKVRLLILILQHLAFEKFPMDFYHFKKYKIPLFYTKEIFYTIDSQTELQDFIRDNDLEVKLKNFII